ncbi:DUF6092 family protein [Nonomuraea sp. NPDC050790]|uniref:DUF6092 family protein n=1 Tax=Nonomuraea sp. NPDC050790 TaxID=3364371 RepID=UPI00378C34E9
MTAADERLSRALHETVTVLVCSAPLAFDETRLLSAFRMLDAADRLMAIMTDHLETAVDGSGVAGGLGGDGFLARARADFADHRMLAMTDQAAFTDWLSRYVAEFCAQALRRTRAEGV